MSIRNWSKYYNSRLVGACFILAFFAYGVGRYLFEQPLENQKYVGAALILTNSILVFLIGLFFRKAMLAHDKVMANLYLVTRILEALALGSIVLNLAGATQLPNDLGYFWGMVILGVGSVPFWLAANKHQLIPAWLAIWGAVGYAIFAFGFAMELFGKAWSMYLLGPGGLWEITFAVWLLIKKR